MLRQPVRTHACTPDVLAGEDGEGVLLEAADIVCVHPDRKEERVGGAAASCSCR